MNVKNRTVCAFRLTHTFTRLGKVTGSERAKLFKNKLALFVHDKSSGIIQPVFKIAAPAGEQTVIATHASTTMLRDTPPYPASATRTET